MFVAFPVHADVLQPDLSVRIERIMAMVASYYAVDGVTTFVARRLQRLRRLVGVDLDALDRSSVRAAASPLPCRRCL